MELRYLTIKETAEVMRISISTLRRYIKAGKVQTHRIGRKYLILETDIPTFFRS